MSKAADYLKAGTLAVGNRRYEHNEGKRIRTTSAECIERTKKICEVLKQTYENKYPNC